MIKRLIMLFLVLNVLAIISASGCKMEISLPQKTFKAGEDVIFRVNLYDSSNNPINDNISYIIWDADQTTKIEKTANSKEIIRVSLGKQARQGQWNILAKYEDCEAEESFFVEAKEELGFSIHDGTLIIKNTGNTPINKEIQIVIGETTGKPKQLSLEIGQQERYQLIAPKGYYNIKVISGNEVLFSKNNIPLTSKGFTGNVIGAINEESANRNPLTGGIAPTKSSDDALLNYMRNSKVTYTFIFVIIGAMILLAIERNYSKKAKS